MTTTSKCSRCGATLASDAPGGLCPRCLLALNLETATHLTGETNAEAKPPGSGPDDPMPVTEVAKLFPQLEILECLGRGGMGAVYKARQPRLQRLVALKLLSRRRAEDIAFAERFAREAKALARLQHPGIVGVHDFGEVNGQYYLLMEYVEGVNLRQLVSERTLTAAESLEIVPQICAALQYAHRQGVVHRDIKPENVLLSRAGQVKIADFGIAKIVGCEGQDRTLTGAKDVIGTPHYMAPEQIEKPLEVDHRADIYSLGVVFYEMLTGELPLGRFAPPSARVRIDVRLDEVVLHALEKERDRRYQHADQVRSAIETIAASPTASTSPPGAEPKVRSASTADSHSGVGVGALRSAGVVGLSVWMLVTVVATVLTVVQPQIFLSVARVAVDPSGSRNQPFDPYALQAEAEVAVSTRVLLDAGHSLQLERKWAQSRGAGTPLSDAEMLRLIRPNVHARLHERTILLEIRSFSASRTEAAEIANAVARSYLAVDRPWHRALVDLAEPGLRPVRPNVPLNLVLGTLAGVVLGLLSGAWVLWRRTRASHPPQTPDASGEVAPSRAARPLWLIVLLVWGALGLALALALIGVVLYHEAKASLVYSPAANRAASWNVTAAIAPGSPAAETAIQAIIDYGGFVERDAQGRVTEVNLVYHEDKDGKRTECRNRLDSVVTNLTALPDLARLLMIEGQATDRALEFVGRLRGLKELYLWEPRISDVGIEHLRELRQLTYLHCSQARLTDRSLALLATLPALEGLALQGNSFTDVGMASLGEMKQLKKLWIGLGQGGVTDHGLRNLKGLSRLSELDLQNCSVTDAGLEHLSGLRGLRTVLLGDTQVTQEGIARLKAAIPGLQVDRR